MSRWSAVTVAVHALALLVVEFKPALWMIATALGIFVGFLVTVGGEFAIALAHDHARRTDELTTLNLTGK